MPHVMQITHCYNVHWVVTEYSGHPDTFDVRLANDIGLNLMSLGPLETSSLWQLKDQIDKALEGKERPVAATVPTSETSCSECGQPVYKGKLCANCVPF